MRAHMETLYEKADKYGHEDYYRAEKVVDGFEYESFISCKLPADGDLFAKLWAALQGCPEQIAFSVLFGLDDEEATRNQLLADAVTSARAKDRILATAAGCELGSPLCINFGGMPEGMFSETQWRCCKTPYSPSDCCETPGSMN